MRFTGSLTVAALLMAAAGAPAAHGQAPYQLESRSVLTALHCLPPCTCPPTQETGPVGGTFTLVLDSEDESYRYYNVLGVSWIADLGGTPTPVVGSGTYRVTTPIAFLHRMQLSVTVGAGVPRAFDSGLVSADVHNLFSSIGVQLISEEFDCNRYDLHLIARPAPGGACYANCDNSTTEPILNISDFICFQTRFSARDPYANCDGSTVAPRLNVNDFICFMAKYAAGCP